MKLFKRLFNTLFGLEREVSVSSFTLDGIDAELRKVHKAMMKQLPKESVLLDILKQEKEKESRDETS